MRLLAFLAALAALAATALAGQELWQIWQDPVPERAVPAAAARAEAPPPDPRSAAPPRDWPPLFGTRVVPEPQPPAPPPPAPEPQPPAPPAPPIESLGYSLKGVVSDGASRWAIVSHPTGEALLKVGDPLGEAYTVTAIDVQGLWGVSSPGAEPQLLGFAK